MTTNRIDTVSARERLKLRREPYWQRISKGNFLGFRRMTADGGTWIARVDQDTGRSDFRPLGDFSDLPAHQRFDAARKAAEEWFAHIGRGGSAERVTVRGACERYVTHVRETRTQAAADDAAARFENYVLSHERLADTELAKLTPLHLEKWRTALRDEPTRSGPRRGELRSASTLNRDMTCLRAALNLAYRDGLVTSDFAWRSRLLPLKNADRKRDLYLERAQRRRFIAKAAPDIAQFLRGLALLPLRPGALAALTVGSFDKRRSLLTIGRDKAGGERRIKLPTATAAFFAEAAANKLPGAPLLARADGAAWNKDAWKWPVKAAAQAAGLPPETTAYSLRHSTITDLVTDGLDLLTVAQVSGTSVRMIEQHYGHLRRDVAAAALARLAL
jgi:site-specific recombinase XerD